jgi:menaquinone-dependent protoporphyrinogen oxidase
VYPCGEKDCRPDGYDGVVVAAPVRGGRYQKSVRRWVRAHAGALNGTTTTFVSVCLGVLQRDPAVNRTLKTIMNGFLAETGWKPSVTKVVAGALPYTRYNWFIRRVMKRIAAKPAATLMRRVITSTRTGRICAGSPSSSAFWSRAP